MQPPSQRNGGGELPDLIVTDQLPMAILPEEMAARVNRGEIGLLVVGAEGQGDVILPADATDRELRLACRTLVEIVRLRRRLAAERRTHETLRTMAYRDPLTGLANRRKWSQELVARIDSVGQGETSAPLGIVLLDLDLFKPLNDQFGHVVGDAALQRVAHQLAANITSQNLAARLGGDEFGVLLSGLLAEDLPRVVERLRKAAEITTESGIGGTCQVTCSAGLVVLPPNQACSPRELLEAADRALRQAKRQGRDRLVTDSLGER